MILFELYKKNTDNSRYTKWIVIVILSLQNFNLSAQSHPRRSFEFVNLPSSARQLALGGINVSLVDRDPNMFLSNPATLQEDVHNTGSINFMPYFADINHFNTTYCRKIDKMGNWGIGVNYLSYGSFQSFDPSGEPIGKFSANEYCITVGNSHTKGNFTLGGNLKFAGSYIAAYSSSALLIDVGGMFTHPSSDFKVGLVLKNIGVGLKRYFPGDNFAMPFDAQLGTSYKPQHMPVRISLTIHSLYKWNTVEESQASFSNQLFRHFVFGSEVLLSKNFNIRVGYNYQRRSELKLDQKGAASGFSFGAIIRVKAFELSYSRAYYQSAGAANCFTLIASLQMLKKKTSDPKSEMNSVNN